jgi:hypothetical protein
VKDDAISVCCILISTKIVLRMASFELDMKFTNGASRIITDTEHEGSPVHGLGFGKVIFTNYC